MQDLALAAFAINVGGSSTPINWSPDGSPNGKTRAASLPAWIVTQRVQPTPSIPEALSRPSSSGSPLIFSAGGIPPCLHLGSVRNSNGTEREKDQSLRARFANTLGPSFSDGHRFRTIGLESLWPRCLFFVNRKETCLFLQLFGNLSGAFFWVVRSVKKNDGGQTALRVRAWL